MRVPPSPPPRRTARLRLTVLYTAAFLVCGAAVLAVVTYLVFGHAARQPGTPPPRNSVAESPPPPSTGQVPTT